MMWMSRKCLYCGKKISEDARADKVYCCDKCRRMAGHKKKRSKWVPKPKKCEYCGKEFMPVSPQQKYCSKKHCQLNGKYKLLTITPGKAANGERQCQYCGKWFLPKHGSPICCSHKCYNKLQLLALHKFIEDKQEGKRLLHIYCENCKERYTLTINVNKDYKIPKQLLCPACRGTSKQEELLGEKSVKRSIPRKIISHASFDETCRRAKAAGMSYGKYVAMEWLKQQSMKQQSRRRK